jgi:protein-tyrosine phosphatase
MVQAHRMIDLHCHMLPGLDDGASDVSVSLAMAKASVSQGIATVACTPHILPAVYNNTGPAIRQATARLQTILDQEEVPLQLTTGADAHITPDFIAGLRSGHVLSLADSRYVLVEPPHHTAPPQLEDFFFKIVMAGYVPILTHPERLSWVPARYETIKRLVAAGVWMQITAGSLTGAFGRSALYWAHRMLDEACVHLLASDAHDTAKRPQNLAAGYECAAKRVGIEEAQCLVLTRPMGVLKNRPPSDLPGPLGGADAETATSPSEAAPSREHDQMRRRNRAGHFSGWSGRLRDLLKRQQYTR